MSTLAAACDAFMRALEEARDLQAVSIPSYARAVLAQLRRRLQALERDCHADQALTPINPAGPPPA